MAYGGSGKLLGMQFLGVTVLMAWCAAIMMPLFLLLRQLKVLRIPTDAQISVHVRTPTPLLPLHRVLEKREPSTIRIFNAQICKKCQQRASMLLLTTGRLLSWPPPHAPVPLKLLRDSALRHPNLSLRHGAVAACCASVRRARSHAANICVCMHELMLGAHGR